MDPLFPPVDLEAIAGLSDEEISEAIDKYNEAFGAIASGAAFEDMEEAPDLNERKALAKQGAETLKALKAARDERAEERERFATEMAEIAADAGVTLDAEADVDVNVTEAPAAPAAEADAPAEVDADADADAADEDASDDSADKPSAVVENAPALVASAERPYRHAPPPVTKKHEPMVVDAGVIPLRASVGIENVSPGQVLDRDALANATINTLRSFVAAPPGFSMKQTIASAHWGDLYPEERRLSDNLEYGKLQAVRGPEALVAAGGWCAPSVIRYDIGALGTTERPVRDALTAFNATRGGIQYLPDISIAATDVSEGITHMTEAEDEGGTATKDCVVVECPEFSDVRADIIAACLQAGNLASIAFPELIAAWQDLLGVLAARTRDSLLLDAIKADPQTTAVSETAQAYGAFDGLVYNLLRLAAGYRSRHRLTADAVLRSLAPAWLADLIVADLVARQFPGFEASRAGVAALIQRLTQVNVDFYLDSSADGGQIIGAQTDGDIVDFPDTAELYLWPEGGILFVDQGELNIGLVRDSVLNETNDVRFFAEVFENAAVIAAEAFVATMTLCPTGTTAGTATARAC